MATFRGWPDSRRDPAPMQGPGGWPAVGNMAGWAGSARRINLRHPISAGLVGWWPMDEGAGTRARDLSIYANAGALANMASPGISTSGWGAGISQKELAFDTVDDSVTVPHSTALANALTSATFSFMAWAKVVTLGSYSILAYKGNAGGIPGPLQIYWEPSGGGAWWFLIGNGSSSSGGPNSAAGQVTAGVWHHVACVRNGSTGYIYLNGQLSGTPAGGFIGPNDVSTALCLGCRTGSYISQGSVQHARLYNRALSAAEVAQIYADRWIGAL